MKTSTTAALGRSTLSVLGLVGLVGTMAWTLGPFLPGGGHDPAPLLSFLGLLAAGLGVGGGASAYAYGLRHQGAAMPPSTCSARPARFGPDALDPADRPHGAPAEVD